MIRHRTFWLTALLALPSACSGDGEADRSVAGNRAMAPASQTTGASNGAAQSENAAATAASADCPYATRNFRASVLPAQAPNTGHEREIAWEMMPDTQRRYAELNVVEQTPLVVIELLPGTMVTPPGLPADWMDSGATAPYDAANTHAVLRCGGRELARVAIPRP